MKNRYVIGIDIGGTNIKAGVFLSNGERAAWRQIPSRMDLGRDHVIGRIAEITSQLQNTYDTISTIGVVVAGIINRARTRLIHSPNLPGWDNFSIKSVLERKLGCSIVLENDANGAALGELWKGVARNHKTFLLLTLGTGLGSGLVLNGKLWTGEEGAAAEMGHTKIVPAGRACGCGAKGCLERYFSNGAIEREVKKALRANKKTVLSTYPLSKAISPKVVYRAARSGDAVSLAIFEEISKFLGIAISNAINFLDIRTFILSGGISNASPLLIPLLTKEVDRNLFFPYSKQFRILKGQLGNRAGATGAAYIALRAERLTRKRATRGRGY